MQRDSTDSTEIDAPALSARLLLTVQESDYQSGILHLEHAATIGHVLSSPARLATHASSVPELGVERGWLVAGVQTDDEVHEDGSDDGSEGAEEAGDDERASRWLRVKRHGLVQQWSMTGATVKVWLWWPLARRQTTSMVIPDESRRALELAWASARGLATADGDGSGWYRTSNEFDGDVFAEVVAEVSRQESLGQALVVVEEASPAPWSGIRAGAAVGSDEFVSSFVGSSKVP